MVNASQLHQLGINPSFVDCFNSTFQQFNLHTLDEQAAFIGQYSHETGHFTKMQEDLRYSAHTLLSLFARNPKRPWGFTPEEANEYQHNAERIGNRIYGNRMGNRDEASGDGFRFHGRGFCQLTGHDMYWHFGQAVGQDFVMNPDLVATPQYAALAGGWYWVTHNCSALADAEDWVGLTKKINGGLIGLDERKALTKQALAVLAA